MMKKLVALVLAMMMLLSVVPAQAVQPRAVTLDTLPNWVSDMTTLPTIPPLPTTEITYDAQTHSAIIRLEESFGFQKEGYVGVVDATTGSGAPVEYDAAADCWIYPLKEDQTIDSIQRVVAELDSGSYYYFDPKYNEVWSCYVHNADEASFTYYYDQLEGQYKLTHYSDVVITEQGTFDVQFECNAAGVINLYTYYDEETRCRYYYDRSGLYRLTNDDYSWDVWDGWVDWRQDDPYVGERPADAPDIESLKPLLPVSSNLNNTSTLVMTTMPNHVSDLVDTTSAPQAPKFDVNYDEATGLLTIKATDAQGTPAAGIELIGQDDVILFDEVGYDPKTGVAVIDLAAAGMTLADVKQVNSWTPTNILDSDGIEVWVRYNRSSYIVDSGNVDYTLHQLTEVGVLTYNKQGDQEEAVGQMQVVVNNGNGEQEFTLNLTADGTIDSYSQVVDNMQITYDAEGVTSIVDYGSGAEWDRETGWTNNVFNEETGEYESVPVEKPEGAPDPEDVEAPLDTPVIEPEPIKPKSIWYPNNTVCVAGLYLKDTVKNLTNKWYNVVPVDISKDGSQTYTLVASGMYVIGRATVTVKGDDVTVTYKYPQGYIEPQSETLAWFTDIDQITTEYLNNPTGNARFGRKVSKANDLNGQDIALLFICNRVTYRQPYYRDGGSLTRYWPNSSYNTGYVKYLKNLLDAME